MELTTNFSLKKPNGANDNVNIQVLNENADIIDAELAKEANGSTLGRVKLSDALNSESSATDGAAATPKAVSELYGKMGSMQLLFRQKLEMPKTLAAKAARNVGIDLTQYPNCDKLIVFCSGGTVTTDAGEVGNIEILFSGAGEVKYEKAITITRSIVETTLKEGNSFRTQDINQTSNYLHSDRIVTVYNQSDNPVNIVYNCEFWVEGLTFVTDRG